MDLPQAHRLTPKPETKDESGSDKSISSEEAKPNEERSIRRDPLGWAAKAAGFSDGERWWENMVEHRQNSSEVFAAVHELMAALRAEAGPERPCVVRKATLLQELEKKDLTIVWGVVGERNCFCHKLHKHIVTKDTQFSGAYYLDKSKLKGGITHHKVLSIPRTVEQFANL